MKKLALLLLAICLIAAAQMGYIDAPFYTHDLERITKLAVHGNVRAQITLGKIYYTNQNYPEAFRWFQNAAVQGNPEAECAIGALYMDGRGVPKNIVEGSKWLLKSDEAGFTDANHLLAGVLGDPNMPRQQVIPAIEFMLSGLYIAGNPVPKDDIEAFNWMHKAAEWGHGDAEFVLGTMYASGTGTEVSYVDAYKWLNLAVAQNQPHAAESLAPLKAAMTPEKIARGDDMVRAFVPKN